MQVAQQGLSMVGCKNKNARDWHGHLSGILFFVEVFPILICPIGEIVLRLKITSR